MYLRKLLQFIVQLSLLAIVVWGFISYQKDPQFQSAVNQRINQLFSTQLLSNYPKVTNNKRANPAKNVETDTNNKKAKSTRWKTNSAYVYIDINNNSQLHGAAIDAMNRWNQTGAFTFVQTDSKKKAQITISTSYDPDTQAAGQTTTTYNPLTNYLIKANVELNRYYLQNSFYGYSEDRIINTAEHELGHAIGLSHKSGVSVMNPRGSFYTIQPQDVRNVEKLYNS